MLHVPEGRLLLQTLRSHDQFNTTIYGLDDRYRGVSGGRRVVFVHPDDIADARPRTTGPVVDLVSEWTDGSERTAAAFRVVPYDQPRGCAAAYYPETNPLVPLDSTALLQQLPDVEVGDRPAGADRPLAGAGRVSAGRRPAAPGAARAARTRATSHAPSRATSADPSR